MAATTTHKTIDTTDRCSTCIRIMNLLNDDGAIRLDNEGYLDEQHITDWIIDIPAAHGLVSPDNRHWQTNRENIIDAFLRRFGWGRVRVEVSIWEDKFVLISTEEIKRALETGEMVREAA